MVHTRTDRIGDGVHYWLYHRKVPYFPITPHQLAVHLEITMRWCEPIESEGGAGFMCFSGPKPKLPACSFCKKAGAGEKQCDFPLNETKTCDAYFCVGCGLHVEPNLDYCPIHKGKA